MINETVTFAEILLSLFEGALVTRKKWVESPTESADSTQIDAIYVHVKQTGIPQLRIRYNDGSSTKWLPKTKDVFAADWYVIRDIPIIHTTKQNKTKQLLGL